MSDLGVNLDKPYAQQPEIQAAAIAYLERTGNADVMVVLGLVEDPVADAARTAKAYRDMGGGHGNVPAARPGYCSTCHNKVTYARACRRTMACRKAAEEAS